MAAPLSVVVGLQEITDDEFRLDICLEEDQRRHLCAALDILALENWQATAYLSRTSDGLSVWLRVDLSANVVQSCVVTLEPVRTHIEHSFRNLYSPEAQVSAAQEEDGLEIVISGDDDDVSDPDPDPDVLGGAGVDVGAAISEQLALIIDPYPKMDGASLKFEQERGVTNEREETHPFAALNSWHS